MPGFLAKLDRFTIGLIVSVGAGILVPCSGVWDTVFSRLSDAAIVLLFFLYGAKLSRRSVWEGLMHWRLQGLVAASTFVIFPLLGIFSMPLWNSVLGPDLCMGMLYVCMLPSTVQSSIAFTSMAGGNVAAAICSASVSSLLGVFLTFGVSRLLSGTLLRGVPSSFTLELPPYRRPRIGQVVVRSVLDRTLFVLGRAAAVAAPAGLLIWLCANVQVGGDSILNWCTGFLDPFARLLGLDGVILMAFLLGFPANEIVIPIIIMAYLSTGSLLEFDSLDALRQLLVDHGWTWLTAVCTMLFSLMHWPCSTTCLTIGKETKSAKWTLLSIAIPTGIGMAVCFLVASAARLLGLA